MILVLFDCDGTLVDSQHVISEAMDRTFRQHGLESPGVERTRTVVGLSLPLAIATLLGDEDSERSRAMAETYRAEFQFLRRQHGVVEPLFPGVRQTLGLLRKREEILIGMVTGKSRRGVNSIIDHHGFDGIFQVVRTADDCPSKPHPAMVLEACAETGTEPQRTIVVGDTRFDIDMARAADAVPVGVSWGYHPGEDLRKCGAHSVIDTCDELLPIVNVLLEG